MPMLLRPFALGVSLSLALTACGGDTASDTAAATAAQDASQAMAVTVAPVRMREIARGVTVSGEVAAVEEMQLGVELTGLRVTELLVDVGVPVRRGQVLMRLDHRVLDSDLAKADAALREAEAGAALARANLARGQQLADQRFLSATQLDELRAARTQSDARVGTARATRDGVALRRSFADLRAPADGVISKLLAQPGQIVLNGGELMRLIRDGRLEWRAELPAAQLTAIQPGQRVELRTAAGNLVEGSVRSVSPGVDTATRTGTVFVDLPKPDGLVAGAYLEGRIDTGIAQAATVPAAAVVLRDGFPTLFVVGRDGVAQARRVRTGAKAGTQADPQIELLDGPKPGEHVVVRGAGFVADGDRVRVVAASAADTRSAAP